MANDFLLWLHQLPTPAGIAVITALFYVLAILIGAGIAFISWKLGESNIAIRRTPMLQSKHCYLMAILYVLMGIFTALCKIASSEPVPMEASLFVVITTTAAVLVGFVLDAKEDDHE